MVGMPHALSFDECVSWSTMTGPIKIGQMQLLAMPLSMNACHKLFLLLGTSVTGCEAKLILCVEQFFEHLSAKMGYETSSFREIGSLTICRLYSMLLAIYSAHIDGPDWLKAM